MAIRSLSSIALALVLTAGTRTALAGPSPKGAPAGYEAKFKALVEAEKNEEFEKALALLDEIPPEKHNVYTRLKRATLLVRLGRFVEAEEILTGLLKDPAGDAVRATVQGDLDDLRARMPKLTLRMSSKSRADSWVTVDDKPVGPPVMIPLNPGTHVIVAKRAEVEVFRQNVTLQDGQNLEVEIDTSIAPPVGSVSVAKPEAPRVARHDDVEPARAPLGGVPFFVAGGVLAAGSIAAFVVTKSAYADFQSSCAAQMTAKCDTDLAGAPRVRTWQAIGWTSGGLALASVGVGIALSLRSTERSKPTAVVAPLVGRTMGVSFEGRF